MSNKTFIEKCGQFFFSRIKPHLFFPLLASPILIAILILFINQTHLQELEQRFAQAAKKEKIAFAKKIRKERFLARYIQADTYFINNEIETISFLNKEKQQLEALQHHPAFPESIAIKERLKFIKNNKLVFAEEKIRTSNQIKEIEEKQRYPIQLDEYDLQQVLALLEDIPVGSFLPANTPPQILITDLTLKKEKTPIQTNVYKIEIDLLKREFKTP